MRAGLAAGAVAAVLSGAPSTVHALTTGRDPLAATLAAGSILLPREHRRGRLVVAAVPVHLAISLGWGLVLARLLPRRPRLLHGVAAGLAIYAFDMGLGARAFPRVRALPQLPQALDHALYGMTVAAVLRRRTSPRTRPRGESRSSPS
jgi:hypothetical protein